MPLPTGTRPQKGATGDFELLPEGMYQVVIEDIEEKEGPSYSDASKMETTWNFKFKVVSDGGSKGRLLWKSAKPVIASGDKPSNLYQIISRAYNKTDMSEDEATDIDPNSLIGRQLMIIVKQKVGERTKKLKNTITEFLAAATTGAHVEPVPMPAQRPSTNEEIDISEIPF